MPPEHFTPWMPPSGHEQTIRWQCGICGHKTAASPVLVRKQSGFNFTVCAVVMCVGCKSPAYCVRGDVQYPLPQPGDSLKGLPEGIGKLYEEARMAWAGAPTATVLLCRVLIHHVAADKKGSKIDGGYKAALNYLLEERYLPRDAEGWVGKVKDRGNDANHELEVFSAGEAKNLLLLTSTMLRVVYEVPHIAGQSD